MLPFIVQNRIDNNEPFDLYFAGSQNLRCDNKLAAEKLPRLFSQYNDRSSIKSWFEYPASGKLFIDSGAHSAHTQGVEIDVDNYIDYVNENDAKIYVFAQVDKIPGRYRQPKTVQDWADAPRMSWENYIYMREKCKSPEKIMPVFHQGENFSWLSNMLDAEFEGGAKIPYIGLSPRGDVRVSDKIRFLDKCFKIIEKSKNPNVKTHALGMTSLDVLEMFPLYSADSTTWLLVGAMGQIMTPWGNIYLSDRCLGRPEHIQNMPKEAQNRLSSYVEELGYDLGKMSEDYVERMLFNIEYLKRWSYSYTYKGLSGSVKSLF